MRKSSTSRRVLWLTVLLASWPAALAISAPDQAPDQAPEQAPDQAPGRALERVQYNHPGLTVDLGVGLWAWPMPMDWDGDGDHGGRYNVELY